jgi:hypothetical protein
MLLAGERISRTGVEERPPRKEGRLGLAFAAEEAQIDLDAPIPPKNRDDPSLAGPAPSEVDARRPGRADRAVPEPARPDPTEVTLDRLRSKKLRRRARPRRGRPAAAALVGCPARLSYFASMYA